MTGPCRRRILSTRPHCLSAYRCSVLHSVLLYPTLFLKVPLLQQAPQEMKSGKAVKLQVSHVQLYLLCCIPWCCVMPRW
jgi:hypothetical protein